MRRTQGDASYRLDKNHAQKSVGARIVRARRAQIILSATI